MTYSQTLDYLYNKLPIFNRHGAAAIKEDIHNTVVMCEMLGNPQQQFKTVHIAGTNGKGSTSHMLAAILQKAGYKTGLYTSPHLKDFRERIRVNGEMIPESFVVDFTVRIKDMIENISPSFFEVTVAMAFEYFAVQNVDVAIIEVGLGGRLDSTNIITPELSVITNISYDHIDLLGNTLEKIAFEKAGIIKPGIPVVVGEKQKETAAVFISKARETSSELVFANTILRVAETHHDGRFLVTSVYQGENCLFKALKLDLTGTYQLKNVLTVIQSVYILRQNDFTITDKAVREALALTVEITGLQGRWQTLDEKPLIIADTGHNIAGITEVLENIAATPHAQLHIVIGMLKDKDITSVLQILPKDAIYYFSQPDLMRAMPAKELAEKAKNYGLKGKIFETISLALKDAKNNANPEDLIFVGGSTFVVAEVL